MLCIPMTNDIKTLPDNDRVYATTETGSGSATSNQIG